MVGNAKEKAVTPAGGFLHFGAVNGDYAVLRGSVPGPASRFVMVRYKVRGNQRNQNPPQVVELSTVARR